MMINTKRINLLALVIIIISAFLRLYKLEEVPFQVNHDELSNIYDGYSIAETGADRWGERYPLLLRAFGDADNRPPLYSWICAASIKMFGYSVTSGRAPSGLIGIFSLILLFLVARKIGGQLFAILSLLLGALSPWHILFSRLALEAATMPSFFMMLSVWLWLKTKENGKKLSYLILLGFTIGFGVNAYQSTKLIFFILAILILIDIYKSDFPNIKRAFLTGIFMLLGAAPQLYMAIFDSHNFFSRASYTMMKFSFSPSYFWEITKNILSNISPVYLFFSFGYNNMSISRLLTIEVVFLYIGLIFFKKVINSTSYFKAWHLYLLLFLAILPSALTVNNPHALRASSLVILYPMASASGILYLYKLVKDNYFKYAFLVVTAVLIVANSGFLIRKYLKNWELKNSSHQNELVQMCQKINALKNDYSKIFIENFEFHHQQYIYIAGYCNINPRDFQKMEKHYENLGVDKFQQLGKYYFFDIDKFPQSKLAEKGKNLIIFNAKDTNYQLVDSLETRVQKFYFYKL